MKHILYFLLIITALSACQNTKQKEEALQKASKSIDTSNMQLIKIEVENHDFEELGTVLRTSSYVQLAPEPLLSSIKEIRIENERIYVHDATSRIICYDMQGKVIYQIDKKGGGPGEYVG
ncbi:MAG: 6-bladed beta-propeller, partial [Cellulosilyticaceae bacterium]